MDNILERDIINKAELRICYDIIDINNPKNKPSKYDLDLNIIVREIKRHLKSISSNIIHVEVYIEEDLVIITYMGKLLLPIPPLFINNLNVYRIVISFELIKIF